MIDTLVAFGCSNTFGSEALVAGKAAPESIYHSYPYFLSQKLNIPNYVNYAKCGISNITIGMKVVNFILKNPHLHKNIFVVIGWTGDNRFPVSVPLAGESNKTEDDECSTLIAINHEKQQTPNHVFDFLNTLHDKVFINGDFTKKIILSHYMKKNGKYEKKFLQKLLRDLLSIFVFSTEPYIFLNAIIRYGVIQLLQSYNISYFTLPTILHFSHPLYKLIPATNNIKCYDDNNNIIFDPGTLFQAYKHPEADHTSSYGHMKIAEYLFDYISSSSALI